MTVYLSHSDHTIFLFAATHFKDSYSLIPSDCKTIVFNIAYKVFVYVVCATVVIALKWATEGSMLVVFNSSESPITPAWSRHMTSLRRWSIKTKSRWALPSTSIESAGLKLYTTFCFVFIDQVKTEIWSFKLYIKKYWKYWRVRKRTQDGMRQALHLF